MGKCRSPHIWNARRTAHRIDLQSEDTVLLINERNDLLIQPSDLTVQLRIVRLVHLQLMPHDQVPYKEHGDEHRDRNEHEHEQH